ncbi:MAG TPA: hypothetical protein PLI43_11840 [Albidovulum sp.]|uniref:hypothetical protein n=1 Tax=Albidovulum sp. TaxID=1872424 RepID=UPI002CD47F42|nr:hypothetical protein [Albidovulum sp.]
MKPGILALSFVIATTAQAHEPVALTISPLVHASRNATVSGELEALGGHPAATEDMFPDPAKIRLSDGRRTWVFGSNGVYQIRNANQTVHASGTWTLENGVFCRTTSGKSTSSCGILYRNGPVYRVTRSTRSHRLQEWSLLRLVN